MGLLSLRAACGARWSRWLLTDAGPQADPPPLVPSAHSQDALALDQYPTQELATGGLRALIQIHHVQTARLLVGRHMRGHEGLQLRNAHHRPQAPRTPWALPRLLVRTRNNCRVGHRPRRWNMGRPKGIVDVQWVCPIMCTRDVPQSFDKFIGTENYL